MAGYDLNNTIPNPNFSDQDSHAYIKNGLVLIGSVVVYVQNKKVIEDLNTFDFGEIQAAMETLVMDGMLFVLTKTTDNRWFICKYDPDDNT